MSGELAINGQKSPVIRSVAMATLQPVEREYRVGLDRDVPAGGVQAAVALPCPPFPCPPFPFPVPPFARRCGANPL